MGHVPICSTIPTWLLAISRYLESHSTRMDFAAVKQVYAELMAVERKALLLAPVNELGVKLGKLFRQPNR